MDKCPECGDYASIFGCPNGCPPPSLFDHYERHGRINPYFRTADWIDHQLETGYDQNGKPLADLGSQREQQWSLNPDVRSSSWLGQLETGYNQYGEPIREGERGWRENRYEGDGQGGRGCRYPPMW